MSHWRTRLELRGVRYDIYFLVKGGRCPTDEFITGLGKGDVRTHRKAIKALERTAQNGLPQNDEQCKQHEDDLWYLKPGQARLFFIIRGRDLRFIDAYKKQSNRLDPRQVRRARRIRDEYLKDLKEGIQ